MAMGNLTLNKAKEVHGDKLELAELIASSDRLFFNVDKEVIPYFEDHWESLSPLPRRVKNTWHATIAKTLNACTELFVVNEENENEFALQEQDLLTIGPMHSAVKQVSYYSSIL